MAVSIRPAGEGESIAGQGVILQRRDRSDVLLLIEESQLGLTYETLTPRTQWPPLTAGLAFCVFFWIKPELADEFAARITDEAAKARQLERRTLVFEAYRQRSDPTIFAVFEVFDGEDGLNEHKTMAHYLDIRHWLETAQAKPRTHDAGYHVLRQSEALPD